MPSRRLPLLQAPTTHLRLRLRQRAQHAGILPGEGRGDQSAVLARLQRGAHVVLAPVVRRQGAAQHGGGARHAGRAAEQAAARAVLLREGLAADGEAPSEAVGSPPGPEDRTEEARHA